MMTAKWIDAKVSAGDGPGIVSLGPTRFLLHAQQYDTLA
jgi:hypothetical protein